MDEDRLKSIVRYQTEEYGCIRVKLAELLDSRGVTRNRLRTLTGVKYDVVDRCYYFRTERPEVIFAMFCGCPARGEQNGSNQMYYFQIFNLEIIQGGPRGADGPGFSGKGLLCAGMPCGGCAGI